MERKQIRLRLLIIIPSVILWITVNLYYLWIKIAGGIFLLTGLIDVACILTILISLIILVIRIIRKSDWRNKRNYFTIGFMVLIFTILNIHQLRVNENTFQSPVQIRACYEGTMNTSHLYFRENGTFEDFNIGWFAFVRYTHGDWNQKGDTVFMEFKGNKPNNMRDTLILKDDIIYEINADSLVHSRYYLGYCKGLN